MKKTLILCLITLIFGQSNPFATIENNVVTEFATYDPYKVDIAPSALQYTIEQDFSNVSNFDSFNFTEEEQEKLLQNYFVVTDRIEAGKMGYKDINDIYHEARDQDIPQFITSDAVLHTFHKLYDNILKRSEERFFIKYLIEMDQALYAKSLEQYEQYCDPFIKSCYKTLVAYFAVPLKILDSDFNVPEMVADTVTAELSLIEEMAGYRVSNIFNAYEEDYSQYKPRGHYTKTDSLRNYFQAMMWHGRQTFVMKDLFGVKQPKLTGAGLALVHLMEVLQAEKNLWNTWNDIYLPTKFFVGEADDLLMQDYLIFAEQEFFGKPLSEMSPTEFLEESLILNFIDQADAYFPEPEIITITPKGMRFMGQRFTPDNHMLVKMVNENRALPKSMDILAILQSKEAYSILEESGETEISGYIKNLNNLRQIYQAHPDEKWAENIYWNWIYCLMPLLTEKDGTFPPFMQNIAWLRKDINTALGSWTELRHDTILYSKQGAYSMGFIPGCQFIKGYVEPNPWLFARLASLTKFMQKGLLQFEVIEEYACEKLTKFEELMLTCKSIAEKELTKEVVTSDEYDTICLFGITISRLIEEDYYDRYDMEPEDKDGMPIVADVYTNPDFEICLEEGVGYPSRIFVVVPDDDQLQIAVGGVFSYYEFINPINERLNDEEWIDILRSENKPEPPQWVADFSILNQATSTFSHYSYETLEIKYNETSNPLNAEEFQLHQNYPNPFNPVTHIGFNLPQAQEVKIVIYSITGEKICTLIREQLAAGYHQVSWNATDSKGMSVPSGVYICKMVSGEKSMIRKMLLIK